MRLDYPVEHLFNEEEAKVGITSFALESNFFVYLAKRIAINAQIFRPSCVLNANDPTWF